MRTFLVLLEREMKSYFYSPIAYIVLCFFMALAGFNAYFDLNLLLHGPTEATLSEAFFSFFFFWFVFVPVIPFITMRLYSEEFRSGTIETLMTAPVDDWQVVLSKFAGALLFYLVLWLPTAAFFVIYETVTHQPAAPTFGVYCSVYFLLLLMGMFYLSLGCLASVVTRNQIIAAVITLVLMLIIFFAGILGYVVPNLSQSVREIVAYFSSYIHMQNYSHGLIDTQPIVFYVTMTIFFQLLTYHVFQYRKWKA